MKILKRLLGLGIALAIVIIGASLFEQFQTAAPKKEKTELNNVERSEAFFAKATSRTVAAGESVLVPPSTQVIFLGHPTRRSDDRLPDGTDPKLPAPVRMLFRDGNGAVVDSSCAYWRHATQTPGANAPMWEAWQDSSLTLEINPSSGEDFANLFFSPDTF